MIATWAISQNSPKNHSSTRFLLLADFTQCIIEALCQSSCCRQCMISFLLFADETPSALLRRSARAHVAGNAFNWALGEPARLN
jgi:hypothetical protein